MILVDSHCHLDFPDFADELDAVVMRANAAGIARMITICTRVSRFASIAALADRYPPVFCTVGTHPHQAAEEPDVAVADLIRLSSHPKCVGIGEAGLDYHYDKVPRPLAAQVFRTHVAAARETGLPLVIHSRDADQDMADILRDEHARGAFPAVLHCFTASRTLAEVGLELGLVISFSGILTFKGSHDLRAIARDVPLDRLLVETDAPFLAPVPHRGTRNEPAFTLETARVLADVKGITLDALAAATTANVHRLFAKLPRLDMQAAA